MHAGIPAAPIAERVGPSDYAASKGYASTPELRRPRLLAMVSFWKMLVFPNQLLRGVPGCRAFGSASGLYR
jgi:hypothetical protein